MAPAELKETKAEQLVELLGSQILVCLKRTKAPNADMTNTTNMLRGYVVDMSDDFMFLGPEPEGYAMIIDIHDIGSVEILNDEEEQSVFKDAIRAEDEGLH